MAALPGAQMGKGAYTEWLNLTALLVGLGVMATSDTVAQAQTKITAEQAAH